MKQEKIEDILRNTDIFSTIPNDILEKIINISSFKILKKDALLISENSKSDSIYVVASGRFLVYKSRAHMDSEIEAQLTILKQGDIVGEMSFLDEQPRSANVKALDEGAAVIEIPNGELAEISPIQFYRKLAKRFTHIIRRSNDSIISNLIVELEKNKKMVDMSRFITYILLLIAFYDLALKGFISLATNPYTSMFASTSVITIFTVVLTVMIKRMNYPYSYYGITIDNWRIAVKESILYSFFLSLV